MYLNDQGFFSSVNEHSSGRKRERYHSLTFCDGKVVHKAFRRSTDNCLLQIPLRLIKRRLRLCKLSDNAIRCEGIEFDLCPRHGRLCLIN